jgi:hypothetical protein
VQAEEDGHAMAVRSISLADVAFAGAGAWIAVQDDPEPVTMMASECWLDASLYVPTAVQPVERQEIGPM